jgi:acetolactate synthase I/II/III large subunit
MTVAEYIADQLVECGVKYVFGIPGGPSIPYMEAFKAAGIRFILTSHESAAGIMANVTARLTGVPGVCHSTFGPGATNITTGAGLALLDRSPLLVFTSEMPDSLIDRTVQMNIDHQKLFSPLTKKTFRISVDSIHEVLGSAISICNEEYPGPVHLGLPSDIADMEVPEKSFVREEIKESDFGNHISELISMLERSRRPLLAVGLTAARYGLKRRILEFLETYPMPVVLTPMAKGLLPEDHPSYAGVLFHALSDYLEDIYAKTDLVIGLGYDSVEYNYESWIPDVPLVHFDTQISELPENSQCSMYIGPVAEWFTILMNLNPGSFISESASIKGVRDEMEAVFNGFNSHFGPVTALKVLREELPSETIITADVGSHLHLIGQYWKTPASERLIITNGWSSMGFGIPAALSAQLNRPGTTVACITGDGGFLMSAGEIMTARRYGLPVKIIVLSDGELNLIKIKQSWKELQPYGTDLYTGDLFGSDSFMGVEVIRAVNEDEMRAAIRESLKSDEPVIINAVIDPEDYKWLVVKQK